MIKDDFSYVELERIRIALNHAVVGMTDVSEEMIKDFPMEKLLRLHKAFENLRASCYLLVGKEGQDIINDPDSGFFS